MNEHFTKNRDKTDERMRQIKSNEVRLEQMRQTVEEKLEKTLAPYGASFERFQTIESGQQKGWEKY